MDSLLVRWGADPIQWRALVNALLRIDFPVTTKNPDAQAKRQARGIWFVLFFFTLYGITPLVVILAANDLLLGATVSVAISAFAVAMTLLTGEANELLSATDLQILGYRPVSSRTYLAVRVTTLMVRSILVAGATTLLPMAGLVVRGKVLPAVGLLVGAQLASTAATLGIVALYAALIERTGSERVKKYVAYANALSGFVVYGGFFVATQGLVKRYVAGVQMNPAVWILFPPTWFASLVSLANGVVTPWAITGVVLAFGSVITLAWIIRDKLSMEYAESLSRSGAASAPASSETGMSWLRAIRGESRAVLLLARSQMVHDMKFRLALISLMPMTAMYMFMGGMPSDPFLPRRGPGNPLVQMVVMFLPMMVRQVIVQTDAHKASWIFHTTPARRSALLWASRNVITAFFLLPYLAVLAAFFAYAFGSSAHALIHAGFMGLLSSMILQFDMMLRPQLPFSMAPMKDTRFGAQMITMVFGGVVGTGLYFALIKVAYKSAGRMLIAAAGCIALIALMEAVARRRINGRRVEELYFD